MKTIILTFCVLISLLHPELEKPLAIPEFEKFLIKNYRATQKQRAICSFDMAIVVVRTDKNGKIVNIDYKNEVSKDIQTNLEFVKGYKFPDMYKINSAEILFFLTVDQQDICPDDTRATNFTASVLRESLNAIQNQVKKQPETIILYNTIQVKVFKPRH